MRVHIIVKSASTNFVLAEGKASVDARGTVANEADITATEQDYILFLGPNGKLHYYEAPERLGNWQVEGLYLHAADLCRKKGHAVARHPRKMPETTVPAPATPTITSAGMARMVIDRARGRT